MAKSTRSKVKRSFRSKKRQTGIYAATEAARLHRLNAKLISVVSKDKDGDIPLDDVDGDDEDTPAHKENLELLDSTDSTMDDAEKTRPVSTHGPRGSRREEWRTSKGLVARPERHGVNRQGDIAGRRKAGRSKRRR